MIRETTNFKISAWSKNLQVSLIVDVYKKKKKRRQATQKNFLATQLWVRPMGWELWYYTKSNFLKAPAKQISPFLEIRVILLMIMYYSTVRSFGGDSFTGPQWPWCCYAPCLPIIYHNVKEISDVILAWSLLRSNSKHFASYNFVGRKLLNTKKKPHWEAKITLIKN